MSTRDGSRRPAVASETLGDHLRQARLERGLGLRALARELDVSPSLVSQIETGRIQPSVRTLYAIVSQLGVSLDEVFRLGDADGRARPTGRDEPVAVPPEPEPELSPPLVHEGGPAFVQRAGERRSIDLETGVRWERLTAHEVPGVEFLYVVYPPGSESAPADALVRHSGRELGFVRTGQLSVTLGFERYELGPGDSVSFESTIPHRLHNDGDEVVTGVWIVIGRYP